MMVMTSEMSVSYFGIPFEGNQRSGTRGREPEVTGMVGEELVAEVIEGHVGDQREALQHLKRD